MKRKEQPAQQPKTAADIMPPLDENSPLAGIAGQVRPDQYARATAKEFAIGKYSARRVKRRYAVT